MKTLVTKGARLLAVLPLLVLFAGTSTFAQVPVSLPDLDTTPGETVTAPVEVGDVSGEDIQAFEFTVTYDPSLVEVTASPSGLSASDNVAEFRANNPSEGELRVAVTSGADAPLDGSGSLAELEVTAASDVAGTTDLTFESFQFNEGTPSATRSGGSVEVKDVFISLPDIVAQSGDEVEIDIETTDLTEVAPESYQFELPYDPSVLSSVEVVQEGTLSEGIDLQSTIDQDGGSVTVAAAAGTDPLEGSGTLLTIQGTLSSGSTPLEFSSFQFEEGRISAGTSAGSVSVADVIASFPEFPAAVGTSQSFSVRTTDLAAGMDVLSYQFTFEFDPDVLDVTGIETEGTLSEGASNSQIQVNGNSATVAVASDSPLEGSGSLIKIQADVVGAGESPLEFRSFQFNEGNPTVVTTPGLVTATAESSSAQFIHNAADPGASPVDIYFGDAKVLDDFEFRTATPFLDVPADTEFEVGVAPGGSSGPGDIIASFPNSFAADTSHTVVANGVLDPGNFAENPDGEDIGFELFVETGAEQSAPDGQVGLRAVHGATDAPTVDIDENGTTLFDNLTYGDVTPDYLDAAAEMKRLVVTPGESEEGVASFQADLSALGGSAATVLASGFLDPAANQDGPGFALVAARPNGDVVVFSQNQAPQFTEVPEDFTVEPKAQIDTTISAEDPDGDEVVFSAPSGLPEGAALDSTGQFTWQPALSQRGSTYQISLRASDGQASADTTFAVTVEAEGQATAQFIHNAADPAAEAVDVYFDNRRILDDFSFRTATEFLTVPAGVEIDIGVAPGDSEGPGDVIATQTEEFAVDSSHTVVANGVLDPGNFAENPDGEDIGFELFVETGAEQSAPDGQVGLRAVHGATDAPTVDIDENGTTLFDNLTYGDVTPDYLDAAAEMKRLVVTPGESEESVAAFQADLSGLGGSAATVLASGFLDPAANQDGPGFALVAALPNGDVVVFSQNQAPQFTEVPGDTSVSVNEDLAVTIGAEDPDGDAITFSLSQAPDNASIDSESGEFSFTPTPQQRNSTFDVGVQASDGQATADTAFAVDVQPIQRDPIAVDIDRAFGDATDDTNYLLVGLPGQVDLPIENTLSGDPGESNDWRAFWDDGSSAFEDGLVEFDGSSTFNFQAGRGFWVLSRNNWTVSQEFEPVPLDDNANASIDLHSGWNIISNPLGKDVSLSAIQAVNDISQPVWSFSGSFDQSSTFASAQSGQAYYFLNEGGQLDDLQIPFFEPSGSGAAVASKKKKNGETLQLDALVDDDEASSVWVGTHPNAKEGRDKFDNFSPPGYFTDATLSVANSEIESSHALASDVRPAGTDGHTYNLVLETGDTDGRLTLRASGVSDLDADTEVRLYNQANGRSVDLRTNQSVDVKAPGEQTEFTLLVGKASYVQQQASEFAPEELEFRQNYPNPFQAQGQTTLEYSLPEQTEVTVGVYDVLGRRVLTLVDGKSQRAGVHTLQWDGRTGEGQTVASGVYFARLEASQTRTIRMVVID